MRLWAHLCISVRLSLCVRLVFLCPWVLAPPDPGRSSALAAWEWVEVSSPTGRGRGKRLLGKPTLGQSLAGFVVNRGHRRQRLQRLRHPKAHRKGGRSELERGGGAPNRGAVPPPQVERARRRIPPARSL